MYCIPFLKKKTTTTQQRQRKPTCLIWNGLPDYIKSATTVNRFKTSSHIDVYKL
jgi:hypothetical protein